MPPDIEITRDGWATLRGDADEMTFHAPSGAGFGEPRERDPAGVAADVRRGFLTRDGARNSYGLLIDSR